MKALLYTSDPYEPSGVIGLFETEEQKQAILNGYEKSIQDWHKSHLKTIKFPGWYYPQQWNTFEECYNGTIDALIEREVKSLKEIEIPVGIYGEYY